MQLLIGTGGWSYFRTPFRDKLAAYARLFNFVEVNSVFYIYPRLSLVKTWRRRVPESFQFTVKCHRDLTHRFLLEPTPDSYRVFDSMTKIAEILRARILVLQTPPNMTGDERKVSRIRDFFSSLNLNGMTLAWEVRGLRNHVPSTIVKLMRDFHIIHVVDLSKEEPAHEHDVLYSRLFGRQLDIEDFENIEIKLRRSSARKSNLTFHSLKMYEDAQSFMNYMRKRGDSWQAV